MDPEYWFLEYLTAIEVEQRDDTLVLRSRATGERELVPVASSRFRIRGSMFDDSTVLFKGESMFVGFLEAHRISVWQSPTALVVYAALLALSLLALFGWGTWRTVRRLRHR